MSFCDWYPLLPTPGNAVSTTSMILWGKQPFSVAKWVMYLFSFPSLSGSKSLVNQTDIPNFPSLSLKVLGCQAEYSIPCWPWKFQAPKATRGEWWPCHRTRKLNSTQSTVYKTEQAPVIRQEFGSDLLLDSETQDQPVQGMPPSSSASSED